MSKSTCFLKKKRKRKIIVICENFAQKQCPSASNKFEEITAKSKGKKIVMFLDYDGTLSPIVDDPDRAYMSEAVRGSAFS